MKASELFPSPDERQQVKDWIDMFDGFLVGVVIGKEIVYLHILVLRIKKSLTND
jgi:tetrahydromethanopterin S-methyltransferase subunit B